jgi:hypothetical protein
LYQLNKLYYSRSFNSQKIECFWGLSSNLWWARRISGWIFSKFLLSQMSLKICWFWTIFSKTIGRILKKWLFKEIFVYFKNCNFYAPLAATVISCLITFLMFLYNFMQDLNSSFFIKPIYTIFHFYYALIFSSKTIFFVCLNGHLFFLFVWILFNFLFS